MAGAAAARSPLHARQVVPPFSSHLLQQHSTQKGSWPPLSAPSPRGDGGDEVEEEAGGRVVPWSSGASRYRSRVGASP